MSNKKDFELIPTIIGFIGIIIFAILATPFLYFACGYFAGWVSKIIIGVPLCRALNVLFNTDYFVKEMLPLIGGALGWIGSFVRTSTSSNKNKK